MNPRRLIRQILLWSFGLVIFASLAVLSVLWWRHNSEVVLPAPGGPYPVGRI